MEQVEVRMVGGRPHAVVRPSSEVFGDSKEPPMPGPDHDPSRVIIIRDTDTEEELIDKRK